MSFIVLKDIDKYYNFGKPNAVHALKKANVEISKGEMVAFMGVSGSGKSTLLNIIGMMDTFDGGTYHFESKDVSSLSQKESARCRNEKIGFVMQNYGLIMHQTVSENVRLPMLIGDRVAYKDITQRVVDLLEQFEIGDKALTNVGMLSGGQQQRVAIARALANSPEVIIADEPTGALDSETASGVMDIFSSLCKNSGLTVIIATHDVEVAKRCDRIIKLHDGEIV